MGSIEMAMMDDSGDGLTEEGAKRLASHMKNFWKRRGYSIETRLEQTPGKDPNHKVWVIRSNMLAGFPPKQHGNRVAR